MPLLDYTRSEAAEPHVDRRIEILKKHPEIRRLFGYDTRPIYLTAAVVAIQLSIAGAFQSLARAGSPWGSWWVVAAVAWLVGAICNHWGGVVIHEASHNLCARTTVANRWVAIFANLPIIVPSAMTFRRYHMGHHRYLGVPTLDNDLPMAFERRWIGNSSIRKVIWVFLYPFFGTLARGFWNAPDRWERINILVQMAANVAILYLLGPTALAYLLLSTLFGYGLHPVAGHFLHEHYLWNETQETYSYYGPLNLVTWNMGYHNEHHDFMAVPGSRLPELRRIAADHYGKLESHRSWTAVLWIFIKTARMGHHSRIVRSSAVYEQAVARIRHRVAA